MGLNVDGTSALAKFLVFVVGSLVLQVLETGVSISCN